MKKMLLVFLTVVLIGFQAVKAQTQWTIDKAHSEIQFVAMHMVITEIQGDFKEFDGSVTSSSDDFDGAKVEFVAQTASINNERRDNHLKSDDFFNAEVYPEIKFNGKIEKEGEKYYLTGDFTMRDVTRPVKFDVKYNGQIPGRRGKKAGFKVTGEIDRFDYNLKWDQTIETGGLIVGREIQIICNVELNEVTGS